jgi:Uma2 family endonuclease
VHLADVYIHFLDGSYKRPDISIFCREPDEEDEAITLVPTAVVELISADYEVKDISIGPQFYLAQGVANMIVLDPRSLQVTHYRTSGVQRGVSPLPIVTVTSGCLTV